jgi:ABC-type microcin C transport system duplicated ATPase subunit YejF
VYEHLEEMDAATAEIRAASLLAGLGFTKDMQNKRTKEFSGGWRMRIALARALFISVRLNGLQASSRLDGYTGVRHARCSQESSLCDGS